MLALAVLSVLRSRDQIGFGIILGFVCIVARRYIRPILQLLLRQPLRQLPHIELAGHQIGDQAGAGVAEVGDFTFEAADAMQQVASWFLCSVDQYRLLFCRWDRQAKSLEVPAG